MNEDDQYSGPRSDGHGEFAREIEALCDWLTEDVAQQVYAIRYDLLDLRESRPDLRTQTVRIEVQLLLLLDDLRALVRALRATGPDQHPGVADLIADARRTAADIHALIRKARCLEEHPLP